MSELRVKIGEKEFQVRPGTPALDLIQFLPDTRPVAGALWNHKLISLHQPLDVNGNLEPVYFDGSTGHKIYRHTLCFLLEKTLRTAFPHLHLQIGPSLGEGYFFFSQGDQILAAEDLNQIKQALQTLVARDRPILPVRLSYSEALEVFTAQNLVDAVLLITQRNEREVACWKCEDWYDLDHFPLTSRTGLVPVFDLIPHKDGVLLRLPAKSWPLELRPVEEKPILYTIYQEYKSWGDVLGLSTLPALNHVSSSKEIKEFVQVSETLQEKKMSALADRIAEKKDRLKLILVAGPSSSGKTTFTKKLAIHLRVLGFRPQIISLDDYFVPREKTPKDAQGNYDFEALQALDIPQLNQDLVALMEGKEVDIPQFDFKIGGRKEKGRPLKLGPRDILMMEGIHGLNDELTPLIPRDRKFKVYISALTQLNLDNHNRISTTDNRLIRRMVRDFQFRGYSALHTLKMWPSVRRGEDKNIFPFQNSADAVFNTALDYELAVLRNYALPLLKSVSPTQPEYIHADRLAGFLENFTPILPQHVPLYSLLREFIGESGFKY